jgi:DNA invertase Pin-like site-specific DNA recombinase
MSSRRTTGAPTRARCGNRSDRPSASRSNYSAIRASCSPRAREEALSVERSTAVRRALNELRAELAEDRITRNEVATKVVELVDRLGLQPVALEDLPEEIEADDVGVVCWMALV